MVNRLISLLRRLAGCMAGVEPHLPSLIPFLFDSLKHEKVRLDILKNSRDKG